MDAPSLRQFRVFRAVMQTGSVTEAATRLGLTQPAVSKTLASLEAVLGLELFKRYRGRLYPGAEAEQLQLEVERLLHFVTSMEERLSLVRDEREGSLGIASIPTFASTILPRVIGLYSARRPGVEVRMHAYMAGGVADVVERHQADIGIIYGPMGYHELDAEMVGESDVVCLVRTEHALARKTTIAPRDLVGEPLVMLGEHSPPGHLIRNAFSRAGVTPRVVAECNLAVGIAGLVREGMGIGIMDPLLTLSDIYPDLVSRPFRPRLTLTAMCLFSVYRPRSRLTVAFVSMLRTMLHELGRGNGLVRAR